MTHTGPRGRVPALTTYPQARGSRVGARALQDGDLQDGDGGRPVVVRIGPRVAADVAADGQQGQDRQNGVDCRTFMDIARVASFLPGAVSKPQDLRQKATRRCFRPAQLAGWARPAGSG